MARSHIPWWTLRTGTTFKGAYVAPLQRGVKGRDNRRRRPKLAPRMGAQMETAFEKNKGKVEDAVLTELDELFRLWERL
jgi:hypothetical protein